VFFVDVRFEEGLRQHEELAKLGTRCEMVKELGRYRAAVSESR
jgi:hypothetical protein